MMTKICLHNQLISHLRFINGLSQICRLSNKPIVDSNIVYQSTSKNIFSNLALEEWLYENTDLTTTNILLIWQNTPSVVIGRHQNPWQEANISLMKRENVILARRSSGGGAVYHDEGNLNLSFIKGRPRYNRKANLDLVVRALTSNWDIDLKINERDDIILDGFYKISGTAAKVGRTQTYHHFTLLHSVEKDKLANMLDSPMHYASSKSTKSVPAVVKNISDSAPHLSVASMVDAISNAFLIQGCNFKTVSVDPENEHQFPGIKVINERLKSWDWLYGKTPTFSIQRDLSMESQTNTFLTLEITIRVEKGCVSSLTLNVDEPDLLELCWQLTNVFDHQFLNMRLTSENVKLLIEAYYHFCKCQFREESHKKKVVSWATQCIQACFQFL